jgi:hypothetical protein
MTTLSAIRPVFDVWEFVSCGICHIPYGNPAGGQSSNVFWLTDCGHILCNNHLSPLTPRIRIRRLIFASDIHRLRSYMWTMRHTSDTGGSIAARCSLFTLYSIRSNLICCMSRWILYSQTCFHLWPTCWTPPPKLLRYVQAP